MSDLVPTAPAAAPAALERVRAFAAQPAIQRVLPWFLGLAAIAGTGLAYGLIAPAPQRLLYSQLDDSQRASVVATLDRAGIGYAIDNGTGALSVDEDKLYRARMLVAADGALAAPDEAEPLAALPLGASRALEGEHLRAAREHELTLTIREIDGVEAVRVHLAEAAPSVFVREDTPPSASVMVRMARGRTLSASQVAAIVNLVAGSVPGLSPDAVRVADQSGRLLTARGGAQADRLELQGRMEDKLRAQLDQLLAPMLGAGNYTSEVQLELDMDQITSARESYDKDGALRSETQAQAQGPAAATGAAAGIPGVVANTPPPATTVRPGPPAAPPASPAPTATASPVPVSGESSATRTYELGREVSVANSVPGKVKRLSVAVAISRGALKQGKPADIDQIRQLVAAAVGADPARGDQVTVMTRPFEPVPEASTAFYQAPWFPVAVRSAVGLLAVLLVLLLGVRPLVKALRREGSRAPAAAPPRLPGAASPAVDAVLLGRQVDLAQRLAEEKPDDALAALRALLAQPGEPVR